MPISPAPPGQFRAGDTLPTGCAREARASPVATALRPVGAKRRAFDLCLPREAEPYAATVALAVSLHGPTPPRAATQRAM